MKILEETKFIMNKYKVKANKNLGQNFLIDDQAIKDIIDGASIKSEDLVIEIGPGLGNLTTYLLEKAKKVICIELDKKMIRILNDRFIAYNNIELINADVLKLDLNEIIGQEKQNNNIKNVKIVANLPYYITTQIVTSLLDAKVGDITILIQKEVADRICAKPGDKDAGAITYLVNYYADCEFKGIVSKECFIPSPKVESAVVNIKRLDKPRVKVNDEKLFFEIIKANFSDEEKS